MAPLTSISPRKPWWGAGGRARQGWGPGHPHSSSGLRGTPCSPTKQPSLCSLPSLVNPRFLPCSLPEHALHLASRGSSVGICEQSALWCCCVPRLPVAPCPCSCPAPLAASHAPFLPLPQPIPGPASPCPCHTSSLPRPATPNSVPPHPLSSSCPCPIPCPCPAPFPLCPSLSHLFLASVPPFSWLLLDLLLPLPSPGLGSGAGQPSGTEPALPLAPISRGATHHFAEEPGRGLTPQSFSCPPGRGWGQPAHPGV